MVFFPKSFAVCQWGDLRNSISCNAEFLPHAALSSIECYPCCQAHSQFASTLSPPECGKEKKKDGGTHSQCWKTSPGGKHPSFLLTMPSMSPL